MTSRDPSHSRSPGASGLTPEESRLLDGVLPAAQKRRLENQIAADPHRAAQLAKDREAARLWKDDAERTAAAIIDDPNVMADRVLALAAQGPSRGERRRRLLSRLGLTGESGLNDGTVMRYAAAAVVLMAIGIGGTWLVRTNRAKAVTAPPAAETHDIDRAVWDGLRRPVREVKPAKKAEDTPRKAER